MPPKSLSFAAVVALTLALVTLGRARADDKPAPAPVPAPTPVPTPPPTGKPPVGGDPTGAQPTGSESTGSESMPKPEPKAAVGYIGLTPAPAAALSKQQRKQWNVKVEQGVVAVQVWRGGPAEVAGLRNGDVLITYAGKAIPSTKDLDVKNPARVDAFQIACRSLSADVKEGSVVEVVVERAGKPVTFKATAIGMDAMRKVIAAAGEDEDGDDDGEEGDEGAEKGDGKAKEPAKTPEKPSPEKPATPEKPAPKGDK